MRILHRAWPLLVLGFTVATFAFSGIGGGLLAGLPPDDDARSNSIRVTARKTFPTDSIPCERVAIGEPDDYKPCIARLPSGELLLTTFHQYQKDGGKVMEQNLLFRSRDEGKTWSPPEKLALLGREPYLTVLRDGTVFITGHLLKQDVRNEHGYTHGYLHRSTDDGKSWETIRLESAELGKPGTSNHSTRNVLELSDGTLLFGVDCDGGGGPYFMWRSTDRGKTWDRSQKCEPGGFKSIYGFFGGETWLWHARSGKILALVRVDSGEFPIADRPIATKDDQDDHFILYGSDNQGRSFHRIQDLGDYGEMYFSILRLHDRRLLLTFTVRSRRPPARRPRDSRRRTRRRFPFRLRPRPRHARRQNSPRQTSRRWLRTHGPTRRWHARDLVFVSRSRQQDACRSRALAHTRK